MFIYFSEIYFKTRLQWISFAFQQSLKRAKHIYWIPIGCLMCKSSLLPIHSIDSAQTQLNGWHYYNPIKRRRCGEPKPSATSNCLWEIDSLLFEGDRHCRRFPHQIRRPNSCWRTNSNASQSVFDLKTTEKTRMVWRAMVMQAVSSGRAMMSSVQSSQQPMLQIEKKMRQSRSSNSIQFDFRHLMRCCSMTSWL